MEPSSLEQGSFNHVTIPAVALTRLILALLWNSALSEGASLDSMDELDPWGFFRNAATSHNRADEVEASFVMQVREAAIIAKYCE
jgi:hypothetical protein